MLQVLYNNVTVVNMKTACMCLLILSIKLISCITTDRCIVCLRAAFVCAVYDPCTLQNHNSCFWFIAQGQVL